MYNYTEEVIGISLNPSEKKNPFIEKCNEFYSEFECFQDFKYTKDKDFFDLFEYSLENFEIENFKVHGFKQFFKVDEKLGLEFAKWIFKFGKVRTAYSGSSDYTPLVVELKEFSMVKNIPTSDVCDFIWNEKHLSDLKEKVFKLRSFCKKTMSEELFSKLDKNIGLVFFQVTS